MGLGGGVNGKRGQENENNCSMKEQVNECGQVSCSFTDPAGKTEWRKHISRFESVMCANSSSVSH